ncbi:M15 family metallopeptidase [Anaerosolibacter sp.]|uniref:M15 family metallopeptidase n=1 Tax=Anaerosolibacter sp. TaxID=1872527 RepID=UPI0039EEB63D
MKKLIVGIIILSLLFTGGCIEKQALENRAGEELKTKEYEVTMKRDLLCLMMAYPQDITGVEVGKDSLVYVVMKSGKRIVYDDKKTKSFDGKLNNADLQDMLEQLYPLTDIQTLMDENNDPGRARVYGLLKEVYGGTKEQIEKNLKSVFAGGKNVVFNKNNGASTALAGAMKEIAALAQRKPSIYPFVYPVNGTYNYRVIAGTNQLSPHAFGTAIDLKRDNRDYWKWVSREEGQKRLDMYPREVVKIFENHGFVWGGKWSHFDILHYEYRPELILKAKYFSEPPNLQNPWYDGVDYTDDRIKGYIEVIERVLK